MQENEMEREVFGISYQSMLSNANKYKKEKTANLTLIYIKARKN